MSRWWLLVVLVCAPAWGEAVRVTLDPRQTHQTIDGFGTCLISWSPRFAAWYHRPGFAPLYLEELGASMLRISLWGPVCPPVEDAAAIRFEDFDATAQGARAKLFMDVAWRLKQRDPRVKIIGSVWSPPVWMKLNQSLIDQERKSGAIRGDRYTVKDGSETRNRLDPRYEEHFARWLVEMVRWHDHEGAPLDAVSIGNEVMFTQSFESCVWNAADYARMVVRVRRLLDEAGYAGVKIFGPETMTAHQFEGGNPAYVEALRRGTPPDIWATHGYVDGVKADADPGSAASFRRLIGPGVFWITEAGTGDHTWPEALTQLGGMLHHALVDGHVSAFLPWQVVEKDANTHGLMTLDGMTKKTRVAQHYFRFVRPGMVRIGATTSGPLKVSAFADDQRVVLVVINPTQAAHTVTVEPTGAWQRVRTDATHDLTAVPADDPVPPESIETWVTPKMSP